MQIVDGFQVGVELFRGTKDGHVLVTMAAFGQLNIAPLEFQTKKGAPESFLCTQISEYVHDIVLGVMSMQ